MKKITTTTSKHKIDFKGLVYSVDESILPMDHSPEAYNFTFRNGVLKCDLGIGYAKGHYRHDENVRHRFKAVPDKQSIKDVFVYHKKTNGEYGDLIVAQTVEGNFYYTSVFEPNDWTKIDGLITKKDVCAVNYNFNDQDILLVSGDQIGLVIFDGETVQKIDNAPTFSSIVVHYERVFGVCNDKKNQVWFSSVLDPTDWTVSGENGGYVTFQDECGDVEEIVSFLGYLYIFREHGIFRLTAYGDQSEFSLKKVFTDIGRIYKHTIVLAGNKILFCTDEGIYTFDGYNVTKTNLEMPKIILPQYMCGAYLLDKYYLCCKIDNDEFVDGVRVNNAILEYDMKEKSLSVLAPYDARRLVAMKAHYATDVLVVSGGKYSDRLGMIVKASEIFEKTIEKFYRTAINDLGTDKVKIVREMTVNSKGNLTVTVVYDGQERKFQFDGARATRKVFVDRCGHDIGFKISTTSSDCLVAPIVVKIDSM